MSAETDRAAFERQLTYITEVITRIETAMPTDEEIAYLRNRKEADERAAWAWRVIKQYAPWVVAASSAVSGWVWYILTHHFTVNTGPK